MKNIFILSLSTIISLSVIAQNVGIGTINPLARLHVAESSAIFTATGPVPVSPGVAPISGAGRRMMWYADKAAFRVGYVDGVQWDKDNIGAWSIATGSNTTASGSFSTAMGIGTTASGSGSTAIGVGSVALTTASIAMGNNATVGSDYAIAIGNGSNASANSAIAMGFFSKAYGIASVAMGNSTALGENSTSMGNGSTAAGNSSTAMGYNTTANGHYSTAMGNYVSTSYFSGAFAIGDNSTTTVMQSFVDNGFRARFAGGYRLFTNSAANIGSFLNAGANSWATLSDVRLKENFLPVIGEDFLKKISLLPLTTWNYKTQDVKTFRHYGPMAQDFYKAFGHDELGEIGCDTLINQQDFLGVNLIAIQALEKRTTLQGQTIQNLKKENFAYDNQIAEFKKEISDLLKRIETLEKK